LRQLRCQRQLGAGKRQLELEGLPQMSRQTP
jgi:hypothetical protein